MKKSILVLVFILLIVGLAACNSSIDASNKAIACGKKAVEIADEYLDKSISWKEADDELDKLYYEMKYVDDLSFEDEHYQEDFSIRTGILLISHEILMDNYESTVKTYDEVIVERNSLAEKVGLSKR